MPHLILDSVGPGATIQDGGRHGWLRYGVTPAGPIDDWVARVTANLALGNAPDAAAIEIGPGGLALTVDAPAAAGLRGRRLRLVARARCRAAAGPAASCSNPARRSGREAANGEASRSSPCRAASMWRR